jgi:hypothetical protein
MENNIEKYKKRFFILMESSMGDVKPLLSEQEKIVKNYDTKYDYKKEGGNYYYKLKNSNDWILSKGSGLESIKTKTASGVPPRFPALAAINKYKVPPSCFTLKLASARLPQLEVVLWTEIGLPYAASLVPSTVICACELESKKEARPRAAHRIARRLVLIQLPPKNDL